MLLGLVARQKDGWFFRAKRDFWALPKLTVRFAWLIPSCLAAAFSGPRRSSRSLERGPSEPTRRVPETCVPSAK